MASYKKNKNVGLKDVELLVKPKIESDIFKTIDALAQKDKILSLLKYNNIDFDIEYTQSPYKDELEELQQILDNTTVLVGFNLKFDLAWLRNYGLRYNGALWDTQYGEYLISNQRLKWYDNSLDNAALRCKLPPKKQMEWDVDTRLIPAASV